MNAFARPTLTRHLTAWVLGALLVVWGSFIAVGWRTGEHEADELTDGHLASVAALMLSHGAGGLGASGGTRPAPGAPASAGGSALRAHDYQQSLSVVIWDGGGRLLTASGGAPVPAFGQAEGFATLSLGQPPQRWRAFSRWDEARTRQVMVLLSEQERDELAQDIAGQVTEPGLWLLPVVALVLGLAIRRGLRPLYSLSRDVAALDIHDAGRLTTTARHEEFASAVEAINRLVERYHAALARERELAGEFAHELRTPLASLTLQARALAALPDGADRTAALARLEHDALRAGEVLRHLLALARASRAELEEAAAPVNLHAMAQRVLAEFAQAAHGSGHVLSLADAQPPPVKGHAVLLEIALRNLVENAIVHTPAGTTVEVELDPQGRWLQVCDTPPGPQAGAAGDTPAPAAALGLGLGHRVVGKIAALHGARFDVVPRDARGRGCHRLRFAADA